MAPNDKVANEVVKQVSILSLDYLIPLQEQIQRLYSEGVLSVSPNYIQVMPPTFTVIVPPETEVKATRNENHYELSAEILKNGKTIKIITLI
jgi:hypothetical protein